MKVRLHELAHARAGDKGNWSNISLIAYHASAWPVLRDQVTEERVLALFRHRGATAVSRYELPSLRALNFVIRDALEGGVNASLNLDIHGKTLSYRLLGAEVDASEAVRRAAAAAHRSDQPMAES